jgi:A/G-specific adenine glycosylase
VAFVFAAISDASDLLRWYDRHRRDLPWRAPPGARPDPYRVCLSEIMLQQTTAAAAIPYFSQFIERFPSFSVLAAAPEEAVLAAWAGLGYYARARNLHRTARLVAAEGLPRTPEALARLPGIGAYTADAIAAIAFGAPVVPVDGNVIRVLARRHAITAPLPAALGPIRAAARALAADPAVRDRAGDFAQALFDLGATICRPAEPACVLCPWAAACAARAAGIAETLPDKPPKPVRPHRHGAHFWLTDEAGQVLLRRRPPSGLLGAMTELPGTAWRSAPWPEAEALAAAPMHAAWRPLGEVQHGFTHFTLSLGVFAARVRSIEAEGFLRPATSLADEALPSVMRKCVRLASAAILPP